VFVTLAYAPWVVRLHDGQLSTTTERAFALRACHADEHGNVVLAGDIEGETAAQVALLHDHDLDGFSSACTWHGEACGGVLGVFHFDGRDVPIDPILEDEVPKRFGFVRRPEAPAA
jgi:hypothetical protein